MGGNQRRCTRSRDRGGNWETVEGLIERLKVMIPELLEANGNPLNDEVPFEILTRRFESTARPDI
jgi:hypothetical protein